MTATTVPANEAIALRSLDLIARDDTGPAVDELLHPEAATHRPGGATGYGRDVFRGIVRWLNGTFADLAFEPLDVFSAGEKVVARVRFRGLHVGPFEGVPPTNRTIEIEQIHVWRVAGGVITDHWACMDELGGLRQMGAAIAPPAG
jgi:predicted ester cyclase